MDNIAAESITGAFIHNLESFLKYESEFKGKVGIISTGFKPV